MIIVNLATIVATNDLKNRPEFIDFTSLQTYLVAVLVLDKNLVCFGF